MEGRGLKKKTKTWCIYTEVQRTVRENAAKVGQNRIPEDLPKMPGQKS